MKDLQKILKKVKQIQEEVPMLPKEEEKLIQEALPLLKKLSEKGEIPKSRVKNTALLEKLLQKKWVVQKQAGRGYRIALSETGLALWEKHKAQWKGEKPPSTRRTLSHELALLKEKVELLEKQIENLQEKLEKLSFFLEGKTNKL